MAGDESTRPNGGHSREYEERCQKGAMPVVSGICTCRTLLFPWRPVIFLGPELAGIAVYHFYEEVARTRRQGPLVRPVASLIMTLPCL